MHQHHTCHGHARTQSSLGRSQARGGPTQQIEYNANAPRLLSEAHLSPQAHLREVVEREPSVPVVGRLHVEVVAAARGGHGVEPLRRQVDPLEVRRLRFPSKQKERSKNSPKRLNNTRKNTGEKKVRLPLLLAQNRQARCGQAGRSLWSSKPARENHDVPRHSSAGSGKNQPAMPPDSST